MHKYIIFRSSLLADKYTF